MPLKIGDSFFLSGTGGANNPAGSHLMACVVIDVPNDKAIIVPVVSWHAFSDCACILEVGDHPFIKHKSCAAYDHAQRVSLSAINKEISSQKIILKSKFASKILVKLQVGLVTSDETEPWLFNAANGTALTAFLKHKGAL